MGSIFKTLFSWIPLFEIMNRRQAATVCTHGCCTADNVYIMTSSWGHLIDSGVQKLKSKAES